MMDLDPRTYFIIAAVVLGIVFLILWRKEKAKASRSEDPYRPAPPERTVPPGARSREDTRAATRAPSGPSSAPPPASRSVTMTRPSVKPTAVPKAPKATPAGTPQKSLDAIYAARHNQWICPYCETMNVMDSGRCVACGMIRATGGEPYAM